GRFVLYFSVPAFARTRVTFPPNNVADFCRIRAVSFPPHEKFSSRTWIDLASRCAHNALTLPTKNDSHGFRKNWDLPAEAIGATTSEEKANIRALHARTRSRKASPD